MISREQFIITREQFVKICTEAILETKQNITIQNQKSGYLKFHNEIKENLYFKDVRALMKDETERNGYSLFTQYQIIEQAEMGNCEEIAEYLSVKIINKLKKMNCDAKVRIVESKKVDHIYLHIQIQLKDENDLSLWEVDAWDPRIIDVSLRPDGSIKNAEALDYGNVPKVISATTTSQFKTQTNTNRFFGLRKPVPGAPSCNATPPRDLIEKHNSLYIDYTLEDAYKTGKLSKQGKINYLQERSGWQSPSKKRKYS